MMTLPFLHLLQKNLDPSFSSSVSCLYCVWCRKSDKAADALENETGSGRFPHHSSSRSRWRGHSTAGSPFKVKGTVSSIQDDTKQKTKLSSKCVSLKNYSFFWKKKIKIT